QKLVVHPHKNVQRAFCIYIGSFDTPSDNVKNMFFRNNSLELKDSWFWNRGILYNSYNPEGTTVSFGICGFVIPLVEWEDFKLMEE
uniref:hypothetical protein n=1 Tax=uncultured Prevotella sp. TaxID=159272 RepID=UPI002604E91A